MSDANPFLSLPKSFHASGGKSIDIQRSKKDDRWRSNRSRESLKLEKQKQDQSALGCWWMQHDKRSKRSWSDSQCLRCCNLRLTLIVQHLSVCYRGTGSISYFLFANHSSAKKEEIIVNIHVQWSIPQSWTWEVNCDGLSRFAAKTWLTLISIPTLIGTYRA